MFSSLSSQGEIKYISCVCVWDESQLSKIYSFILVLILDSWIYKTV